MNACDHRREDEVEVRLLEGIRRRCPDDDRVWRALAGLYTRVGRHEDGLAEDLKLAQAFPCEPDVWYNLACSHALLGHVDDAFTALHTAVEHGYQNAEWMIKDKDLQPIRNDPRFNQLLALLVKSTRP